MHLDRKTIALVGTLLASTAAALAVHAAGAERAFSSPPPATPLEVRIARGVIHGRAEEVRRACWQQRPADDAETRLKLDLIVAPDGTVAIARVDLIEGDPAVAACVRDQASAWTFPASALGGRFVVPFELSDR